MRNFFDKVARFMYGRNGNDKLNFALFVLWLIINIINTIFIRSFWVQMFDNLIVMLIIFRCLSKNIPQRNKENQAFIRFCEKIKPFYYGKVKPFFHKIADWFKFQSRKFNDRKTHRYIKCRYCKATIRVPFAKGKHTVKCPRCSKKFKTNIRF